jgi:LPXTG-site transpeptidase (sortase) family protein
MNPLFPDDPSSSNAHSEGGYILPRQERRVPRPGEQDNSADPAIDLIRRKIDALYADEPGVKQELAEAAELQNSRRSKHQQFMYDLSTSGKPLAEIQTAWHDYYLNLSDDDKREVWQEFYAANSKQPSAYVKYTQRTAPRPETEQQHHIQHHAPRAPQPRFEHVLAEPEQGTRGMVVVAEHVTEAAPATAHDRNRNFAAVKKHVLKTVRSRSRAQIKAKEHLQSLAFGLGTGALVLLIVLFSFFNEMIIAPFIHPGAHAEATPIILSTDGIAPTDKNEVIIPKINVELPYITGNSTNENDIENTLEDGIAHYPTTALPGQQGNAAFFGHSSNNIFNKGKYKFAFVLLHEMEPGDIFYLTNNGKIYTYKIFQKKVVEPSDTWVLNPVEGHTSTAVLITCDPPGTSKHRLVVWGDQVSPDPNGNTAAVTQPTAASQTTDELPSNSPSLWSRFYHWATPF